MIKMIESPYLKRKHKEDIEEKWIGDEYVIGEFSKWIVIKSHKGEDFVPFWQWLEKFNLHIM